VVVLVVPKLADFQVIVLVRPKSGAANIKNAPADSKMKGRAARELCHGSEFASNRK